ncbi:MAG: MBL fold metallo-hydrolase [Myxococcales bacterium]|nr:MBL fold metallo-hydrolase [Myxococcales bacterium]
MNISFLGPIGCVTGSCYWLRHHPEGGPALEFLVDCGARQGERDNDAWNKAPLPFRASRIDFVLLTHAHLDHSGLLPRLAQEGFRGEVYCTEATRDIAVVTLSDGAKHEGASYTMQDVERLRFCTIDAATLGACCHVKGDVFMQAYRTAHIYGAVSIRVLWGPRQKQRSITFSGDLGPNESCSSPMALHAARQVPPPSEYVLVESTYGNRARPAEECSDANRLVWLRDEVQRAMREDDGVLLIPCFAVDRLQAVLFDLHRLWWRDRSCLLGAQVVVHSAMATKVNHIYARHISASTSPKRARDAQLAWCGDATIRALRRTNGADLDRSEVFSALAGVLDASRTPSPSLPRLHRVAGDCDEVLRLSGRKIILTTAGMCSGGPIQTYLSAYLHHSSATVLLTGYQSEGTLGRQLQDLHDLRQRGEVREMRLVLGDKGSIECRSVRAMVGRLRGYSAHADQTGLVRWLLGDAQTKGAAGGTIFLTHGDENARHGLRVALTKRILARGGSQVVETPHHPGEAFDLDAGRWLDDPRAEMHAQLTALWQRVERLETQDRARVCP